MTLPGKTRAPQSKTPRYRVNEDTDYLGDPFWRVITSRRIVVDNMRSLSDARLICRALNQSSGRKGTK